MPGFELSVHIERPPKQVWAVLADLEAAPAWMPGVEFIALDEDGPLVEGSVFRFRVDGLKGELQKGIVTAVRPERELVLEIARGRIAMRYAYALAAVGGGTDVRLTADCMAAGWLQPFAPLMAWLMRRSDRNLLVGLRAAVEAGDNVAH